MRYELADYEWSVIRPILPNKPRGVPRVDDWRILHGILWVLRSGAPWRDLPESFGPDDKLAANYLAFIKIASIGIWLRAYECAP